MALILPTLEQHRTDHIKSKMTQLILILPDLSPLQRACFGASMLPASTATVTWPKVWKSDFCTAIPGANEHHIILYDNI